ncbi:hypothetical protein ACFYO9_15190 [Streptomyces sp. NPDC005863]|uniref:hypothetical protein n=1 Tax=unclassified Streptomyces TaxID=2593676 RepID=UPI0033D15FBA
MAKRATTGRRAGWAAALTSWVVIYGVLAVIWHAAFDYSWAEVTGFAVALTAFQATALWAKERWQHRRGQAAERDE